MAVPNQWPATDGGRTVAHRTFADQGLFTQTVTGHLQECISQTKKIILFSGLYNVWHGLYSYIF